MPGDQAFEQQFSDTCVRCTQERTFLSILALSAANL